PLGARGWIGVRHRVHVLFPALGRAFPARVHRALDREAIAHRPSERRRREPPGFAGGTHGFRFSTTGGTRKNPCSLSGAAAVPTSAPSRRPSITSARSGVAAGANA